MSLTDTKSGQPITIAQVKQYLQLRVNQTLQQADGQTVIRPLAARIASSENVTETLGEMLTEGVKDLTIRDAYLVARAIEMYSASKALQAKAGPDVWSHLIKHAAHHTNNARASLHRASTEGVSRGRSRKVDAAWLSILAQGGQPQEPKAPAKPPSFLSDVVGQGKKG